MTTEDEPYDYDREKAKKFLSRTTLTPDHPLYPEVLKAMIEMSDEISEELY